MVSSGVAEGEGVSVGVGDAVGVGEAVAVGVSVAVGVLVIVGETFRVGVIVGVFANILSRICDEELVGVGHSYRPGKSGSGSVP